ncbi:selenide, water dikinase SelD [Pararhodobacter sp.]|uniref:selenide, water dikinase SelD n=1 Tax=Pararhodobacter sp. TaxID=2127056 RepID=UPI002AFE2FA2|nr:selenide, water dikinase SelD [Pararhodobacter sp.]
MLTLPQTRDLVLVGGGHAHALLLLNWAMNPLPGARLTVIDPNPTAPYTGMLPGHIAGHYTRADLEMNLVALARHAGARLIAGRAEGIDTEARTVQVAGRPPLGYDIASFDIGITSDLPRLPGFSEHAIAAKPLGGYSERWARFVSQVEASRLSAQIVILGAGVAGVELAMAMDHRLHHIPNRRITLIEHKAALPHLGHAARKSLLAQLENRGITLLINTRATSITDTAVHLDNGTRIEATFVLGAAGSRPQDWLQQSGLRLHDGFIAVDPMLRSLSHPDVFAVGDCAHMAQSPRPKAGVFAVRQAPFLTHNLRAALSGGTMRPYRPQSDYLKLVSLGGKSALADKWGLPLSGRWLWQIKNRIDRKFMRMFHALPTMPTPSLPSPHSLGMAEVLGDKPMCGGCGAKVGPQVLRSALADLGTAVGVELGAGDDAAVLTLGQTRQVIATDHLRAVTDDPWLMARIATVHALGDIWAMGATPQAALLSLILPRLSDALQTRTLAEIMAGVTQELAAAGSALVGGHTTIGSELTIGLTVTGIAQDRLLTKVGAQPGDALLLTKPIGSGTLLAAEMAKQAPGRAIAALWPYLTQSQAEAARLLAPHAHAMTDITGFGLAGHLDEILHASALAAEIHLHAIPTFDGAQTLADQGTASTLAPANRAALIGRIAAPASTKAALLFDPQTSGGLLAAVPPDLADHLLHALISAGYTAAQIGTIQPKREGPALRVT